MGSISFFKPLKTNNFNFITNKSNIPIGDLTNTTKNTKNL